ncbi:hypothetical protein [Natronoarchaeum rubrum]|uniref:hypothetical protein n=1 Tax=Natronoarchaeum rubrum TaxID=755311 RepID=UPI002112D122|nr:hypothetical protein [Natronoarchaeum rubrum]
MPPTAQTYISSPCGSWADPDTSDVSDEIVPIEFDQYRLKYFPDAINNLHAIKRRKTIKEVVDKYLTYRKYLFDPSPSRIRAEKQTARDFEVTWQSIQAHIYDLYDQNEPLSAFEDDLERVWEARLQSFSKDQRAIRNCCQKIKNTLESFLDIEASDISLDEITYEDLSKANDLHLVQSPEVLKSLKSLDEYCQFHNRVSIKPKDITGYDIEFGRTWKKILSIIEKDLNRNSKEDDAISLTNDWDCTEAYAVFPDDKNYYEKHSCSISIKYHRNGKMNIEACLWPSFVSEDSVVRLSTECDGIGQCSINLFIVHSINQFHSMAGE